MNLFRKKNKMMLYEKFKQQQSYSKEQDMFKEDDGNNEQVLVNKIKHIRYTLFFFSLIRIFLK
jgi:malate synthase